MYIEKDTHICTICNKEVANNNSNIGSHVKRKHGISYIDYHIQNFINLGYVNNIHIEKCSFCDNEAKFELVIDKDKKEIHADYNGRYKCNSLECKNQISIDILGTTYNKKTFEHIGSMSEYIAKLKRITIEEVKYSKSKGARGENQFISNKENYIERYGEKEGIKKYNDRCLKIKKSMTSQWYIDKYGKIEGLKKWYERLDKAAKGLNNYTSKKSNYVKNILDECEFKYIQEHNYDKKSGHPGKVDFYLPKENIVIEYFGLFWHASIKLYEDNYYNKKLEMTAKEIRERNYEMLNHILHTQYSKPSILVIWEDTKISSEYLKSLINQIRNKNIICEI